MSTEETPRYYNFSVHPEQAGRRKANGNGAVQLKALWDNHHVMKRLTILGWNPTRIAEHLGMTPEGVRVCLNSELMRRELELLRAVEDSRAMDISKKISEMAEKSCNILEEILDDDNAPVAIRSKIALDMLSRAGHPPHTKISGTIDHRHLTDVEVERIKIQAKALPETILDAEFVATESVDSV